MMLSLVRDAKRERMQEIMRRLNEICATEQPYDGDIDKVMAWLELRAEWPPRAADGTYKTL